MPDSEKEFVQAVGAAVAKSILYICLTATAALCLYERRLSPEMIEQCEESCSGTNTHMESVTYTKCECAPLGDISKEQNIWALPR